MIDIITFLGASEEHLSNIKIKTSSKKKKFNLVNDYSFEPKLCSSPGENI